MKAPVLMTRKAALQARIYRDSCSRQPNKTCSMHAPNNGLTQLAVSLALLIFHSMQGLLAAAPPVVLSAAPWSVRRHGQDRNLPSPRSSRKHWPEQRRAVQQRTAAMPLARAGGYCPGKTPVRPVTLPQRRFWARRLPSQANDVCAGK